MARTHILVASAGSGGLADASYLARAPVGITIIDKRKHDNTKRPSSVLGYRQSVSEIIIALSEKPNVN